MTDQEQEYDSGPYCKHWSDPYDCDDCRKMCIQCFHMNREHGVLVSPNTDNQPCEVYRCVCLAFNGNKKPTEPEPFSFEP